MTITVYKKDGSDERQYQLRSNWHEADRDNKWEDIYVEFSGYFGKHNPNVFAAATELYEALIGADKFLQKLGHSLPHVKAALAKARVESA